MKNWFSSHLTRFQRERILLRNNDQKFLAFALICAVIGFSGFVFFDTTREEQRVPQHQAPVFQVDLNTAQKEELLLLPGIGEVLAERIIEHRTQYGPFTASQEIVNVKGIGPKKHEKIDPFLVIRK